MQSEYYIVWAYRYSNPNAYNFPIGIFETEEEAISRAENHRVFRGFKYDHKIWKLPVGKSFDAEEAQLIRGLAHSIS